MKRKVIVAFLVDIVFALMISVATGVNIIVAYAVFVIMNTAALFLIPGYTELFDFFVEDVMDKFGIEDDDE